MRGLSRSIKKREERRVSPLPRPLPAPKGQWGCWDCQRDAQKMKRGVRPPSAFHQTCHTLPDGEMGEKTRGWSLGLIHNGCRFQGGPGESEGGSVNKGSEVCSLKRTTHSLSKNIPSGLGVLIYNLVALLMQRACLILDRRIKHARCTYISPLCNGPFIERAAGSATVEDYKMPPVYNSNRREKLSTQIPRMIPLLVGQRALCYDSWPSFVLKYAPHLNKPTASTRPTVPYP